MVGVSPAEFPILVPLPLVPRLRAVAFCGVLAAFPVAGVAHAQALRDLCADRPGLATPACTVDAGHVMVEIGVLDWQAQRSGEARTDTISLAETLVRTGLDGSTELQLGWTPLAIEWIRSGAGAGTAVDRSPGDLSIAVRRNLRSPDGTGLSLAVMPYTVLPLGGTAIGAGDWGMGVIVPVSIALGERFSVALSPSVAAAVDQDRRGRHAAYGSVIGIDLDAGAGFAASFELQAVRDRDPSGHVTRALASAALAFQPDDDLQFDIGAVAGLNAASPDLELYLGVARRF